MHMTRRCEWCNEGIDPCKRFMTERNWNGVMVMYFHDACHSLYLMRKEGVRFLLIVGEHREKETGPEGT